MVRVMVICAALALGGCSTVLPGTTGQTFDLNKFLTDPACAHDDKISGITGAAGVPASLQFSAERHCPGQPPATPAPSPAPSPSPTGK